MTNEKDPTDSKIAMIDISAFCKAVEWKWTECFNRGQQMSFEMALTSMKQGKKIRRASWADSKRHLQLCPEIDPNDIFEVDEYWTEGVFTRYLECRDVLASDWEVVE